MTGSAGAGCSGAAGWDAEVAAAELVAAEPRFAPIVARAGAYDVVPDDSLDVYGALARSIVYQQLHGSAARAIFGRLKDLHGGAVPPPDAMLALEVAQLRGAGLSGAKAAALRSLAEYARDGLVPDLALAESLPDNELIDQLTAVRGIGPWTVQMLLLFRLRRPDVLPTGDLGVRVGWGMVAGLDAPPPPRALAEAGEAWRPWRSVASWYLWRAVDLHREDRRAAGG